ncbi:MAG: phosphohistidine phosphatase [Pseudomonadota bacterium]
MLNLYVMRHSKSSWNDHNISDFERPLSSKGRKDIKFIIKFLKIKKIKFDFAYVSSSKRTKETFKLLKKKIKIKKEIFTKKLYLSNENKIFNIIKKTKNNYKNILLVNHEPTCKNLVNKLIKKNYFLFKEKKFSTSAITKITFSIKKWKKIKERSGKLVFFKRPIDLA